MHLEPTPDQHELRHAARRVLTDACPPSLARAVHDSTADGLALWQRLVQLDWPALGLAEEDGGLGLGFAEVAILTEELGRAVAPTPFLATVTQMVPAVQEAGSSFRLADVASGACTGTLAVAEHGTWSVAAVTATARAGGSGWVLDGCKSHVLDGHRADEIVVVARAPGSTGDEGLGVFVVPSAVVHATPMEVMDPTMPIATVHLTGVEVGGDRVLAAPGDPAAPHIVRRSLEAATTALALSTIATCRSILEMTLQHAKDREQFGRPIGSFQALQHRLADLYLAVERAASLGWFAVLTIAEDDDRRAVATAMAKAAAGDCQRLVARDGLQLHGAVGFTWEHDLHLFLKRAKTGEPLFGGATWHRARLARLLGLEPVA